jgi:hypothetical protein
MPLWKRELESVMKTEFLKRVKLLAAPAALAIAMLAFGPSAALAAEHGGHGYGGGHGFSGGHSFSGAVHGNFSVGRSYGGRGYYAGRPYGGSFYNGGRYYGGRGYYGPGFGFGIYAAPGYGYGYSAPACSTSGFYDQRGYWHYYPGCIAPPYGY